MWLLLASQNVFAILLYSVPEYHTNWHLTMEEACQKAGENLVEDYNKDPLYGVPATLVSTWLSQYYETTRCAITRTNYTGVNTTVFLFFATCTQYVDQGCVVFVDPKKNIGSCPPGPSPYVGKQ